MATTILSREGVEYGLYVNMETIICYKCAVPFAIPERLKQHLRETGDSFYCPNGHSQAYVKSETTRLKEKLEKQEREFKNRIDNLHTVLENKNQYIGTLARQKSAVKGLLTKVKNRIKNGVCPCCNRTFQNLHQHMKSQHPDYNEKAI